MIDNFEDAKHGGSIIGSGHFGRILLGINQGMVSSLKHAVTQTNNKIISVRMLQKHQTGYVYLTLEEAAQLVKELSERIVYADDVINGRLDK